jgi:hypothetical protein
MLGRRETYQQIPNAVVPPRPTQESVSGINIFIAVVWNTLNKN